MVTGGVDLQASPSGQWMPVLGAQVVLPEPGRYEVSADVRARIASTGPSNAYIVARLFNLTAGAAVPDSQTLVLQVIQAAGDGNGSETASLSVFIDVTASTTIQLQCQRVNNSGNATTSAAIDNDGNGHTRLRYRKVVD